MNDETLIPTTTPVVIDTAPPLVDADGRALTRTVEVAKGPNTNVHTDQVKTAHAAPDGEVQFITHEDGSKSVAYAEED